MKSETAAYKDVLERLLAAGFDSAVSAKIALGYSRADADKLLRRIESCLERGWWADSRTWRPCDPDTPGAVPDVARAIFFEANAFDSHEEVRHSPPKSVTGH